MSTPKYQEGSDAVSTLTVHVKVEDVNDNTPSFVSKIFTGGITTEADFGLDFMQIKVRLIKISIYTFLNKNKYIPAPPRFPLCRYAKQHSTHAQTQSDSIQILAPA